MPVSNRELWFADVLRAGLETRVLAEPDVLAHATPAILIGSLPKPIVVKLLDATLATGTMSPQAVLQVATPELLAEHVPPPVLWGCLAAVSERAGIPTDATAEGSGAREFLRRALEQALLHGVAAPADVVQFVDAGVLGHHFPDALTTKLLEASLTAGKMNPELIVETLGVEAIAKHAPTRVVWGCLAKVGTPGGPLAIPAPPPAASAPAVAAATAGSAGTAAAAEPAPAPASAMAPASAAAAAAAGPPAPDEVQARKPSFEVFDDDAPSVLVELDEPSMTVEVHEAPPPVIEEKKKPAMIATSRVVKRA